ncbi:hypothetical protein BCS96_08720 [Vibrio breoganii]|uniref:restriction endonuclease subunit S n=2 Tax=Vibrio breoganii TaxID=553239 RepID=UPI000C861172|nr:restriction endonuclease subunit S [Vibrio breoganii]PMG38600.1 hypothetical protein BCU93_13400 [Vibrio breoganii]PML23439.1 hypothetical protein BCT82_15065 [Vibrio breoganii]PML80267.1 hypothetical protein BCT68_15780 [Vibrio breoganii]PMO99799.1 hypothetical protein BCS96_08720 [Vibrio breoganii]
MIVNNLRVEDICSFIGGSQPAKSQFINELAPGYVRLIQTRDYKTDSYLTYIPQGSTKKFCDEEDVMIGRYGPPVFQICRGLKGAYNVALMKAKPKEGIDREFLYYFLKQDSVFRYVDKLSARTGGQTGVDLVSLNKYPVRVPCGLEEQQRLVAPLVYIDKKIDVNDSICDELEAMVRTLYDYWFVQFDFPSNEGKPYKSSGGQMVFDKSLNSEVPDGWQVEKLKNLTSVIRRGISPKYVEEGGIPVLNQKCIRNQKISFKDGRRHKVALNNNDERLLKPFDVVVNSTGVGTLGRVAYVKRLLEKETTVDSHVSIVRANRDLISSQYLAWYLMKYQPVIESAANGSTGQVELSKGFLENIDVIIPSESIVQDFIAFVEPIVSLLATREAENEQLISVRDWLLPMLMNGQVTVK